MILSNYLQLLEVIWQFLRKLDLFSPGNLLHFGPYTFQDGGKPKNKFGLVLFQNEGRTLFLNSLTTTVTKEYNTSRFGCFKHEYVQFFCFPAYQTMDEECKFYFKEDTIIPFRNNIRQERVMDLQKSIESNLMKVDLQCNIGSKNLKRILKCLLKTNFCPVKFEGPLKAFKESL